MATRDAVVRTRWRWIGRVLRRYDADRRPKLTAWIMVAIVAVIAGFGFLGYAIPAFLAKVF